MYNVDGIMYRVFGNKVFSIIKTFPNTVLQNPPHSDPLEVTNRSAILGYFGPFDGLCGVATGPQLGCHGGRRRKRDAAGPARLSPG